MQVGDLVKMEALNHIGIITQIAEATPANGHHTHRVLFSGTGYKELDGYHWCNPNTLEKI